MSESDDNDREEDEMMRHMKEMEDGTSPLLREKALQTLPQTAFFYLCFQGIVMFYYVIEMLFLGGENFLQNETFGWLRLWGSCQC